MAISTFQGLNTALKGLNAAQIALDTIGHNVSNADTAGYSRQVATLGATNPTFTTNATGQLMAVGTGVDTSSIVGIRESYINQQMWEEGSNYAFSESAVTFGNRIEDWFNEPSTAGLQTTLNNVWNSIQSLATDASQSAQRQTMRSSGKQLCDYVDSTFQNMQTMVNDINSTIKIKVSSINQITSDINDLNNQISTQELTGIQASDLRDRRDVLVGELAAMMNVTVTEDKIGKYNINCNGQALVTSQGNVELAVEDNTTSRLSTYYGIVTNKIVSTDTGKNFTMSSGEVQGLIFMRDDPSNGITAYLDRVDNICRAQMQDFNRQHRMGYTLDGTTDVNFYGESSVNYDLQNSTVQMSNLSGGQMNISSRTAYIDELQNVEVKVGTVAAGEAQSVTFTIKDKSGNIIKQGSVNATDTNLQDENGNNIFVLPNGLEVSINKNANTSANDTYSFDIPSAITERWQPTVDVPSGVSTSSVAGDYSMLAVDVPNTAVSVPNLLVGFKNDAAGKANMYVSIDGGNSWSNAIPYSTDSNGICNFDLSKARAQGTGGASYGLAGNISISDIAGAFPAGFDPSGAAQSDKTYKVNFTNNTGGWIGKMQVNQIISNSQNGLRNVAAADITTTYSGNSNNANATGGKCIVGSTSGCDADGKATWPPANDVNFNIKYTPGATSADPNVSLSSGTITLTNGTSIDITDASKCTVTYKQVADSGDSSKSKTYVNVSYTDTLTDGSTVNREMTFTVNIPSSTANQSGDTYNMLYPPGSANGDNAFDLGVLMNSTDIASLGKATINDYYNTLISDIGNQVSTQINLRDTQKKVALQLTNWRDSVSGVNMDEEMANMIKYQRAYGASAKMVTTINELVETLIQAV